MSVRHFAYTTATVDTDTYTDIGQIGDVAYELVPGTIGQGYAGLNWHAGAYEGKVDTPIALENGDPILNEDNQPIKMEARYVIAYPRPDGTLADSDTPIGTCGFVATETDSEASLISLVRGHFGQAVSTYGDALDWIAAQEFWTNAEPPL